MIETIQEMDHYVRIAFGVSDDHYGYDPNHLPPQGVLQGNGADLAAWFAIHSVLVKILHDAGFGYKAWTLICSIALRIACFAFVDDNDLIHSNNNPTLTSAELIHKHNKCCPSGMAYSGPLEET